MSANRELLELAAKAAGIEIHPPGQKRRDDAGHGDAGLWTTTSTCWNPLMHNTDAFRLAVALRISLEMYPEHVYAVHADTSATQYRDTGSGQSMEQVVREAITACAAEIGRSAGQSCAGSYTNDSGKDTP